MTRPTSIKTSCSSRLHLIALNHAVYPVTTRRQGVETTELLLGSEGFVKKL